MKKSLFVFLTLALVVFLSVAASAEGMKIEGGYLLGNYDAEDLIKGKMTGFMVFGEAPLSGSLGVMANLAMLEGSDFEIGGVKVPDALENVDVTRFDILGTYAFPAKLPNETSLKVVGGWSNSKLEIDTLDDWGDPVSIQSTVKGFLVGAAGEFALADKLTVSGFFGFGLGMKYEEEGWAGEEDAGLTTFRFAGNYHVQDNISIVGGYTGNTYSYDDLGVDDKVSGFFFGAQMKF